MSLNEWVLSYGDLLTTLETSIDKSFDSWLFVTFTLCLKVALHDQWKLVQCIILDILQFNSNLYSNKGAVKCHRLHCHHTIYDLMCVQPFLKPLFRDLDSCCNANVARHIEGGITLDGKRASLMHPRTMRLDFGIDLVLVYITLGEDFGLGSVNWFCKFGLGSVCNGTKERCCLMM